MQSYKKLQHYTARRALGVQVDSARMTGGRLDVWLWSVRLAKTRSLANKAVSGGHVRLNGESVKPAHSVKPGDIVTIREPGWERRFEVTKVITKRVGAPIAVTCCIDHSPPRPAYLSAPQARRDRGAGRPTKRDRRQIDRLRGRDPQQRSGWGTRTEID